MNEQRMYQFAQSEFDSASQALAKLPPQEALVGFYRRLDAAVAKAIEESPVKPACRAGCSFCCYYKVEARAVEVLAIRDYVLAKFKPELIRAIVEQANRNVAEAKTLTHIEHLATNQRCPFLVDDKCAVYTVRPSKCRNFHAADMQGCKGSYDQPTNLSIPNSYIPEVFDAANGITQGFEGATEHARLDQRVYDLNSAFIEALKNPQASKRLRSGKKAFLSATVVQLPNESAL
jgi:Fe-S-cluster containining protein